MKFRYLDKVIVSDGAFFEGTEGEVVDTEQCWNGAASCYRQKYLVRFFADGTKHWFDGALLEEVAK